MFYREKVEYPALIWEEFAFQIDHKMEKQEDVRICHILKYRLPIPETMLTEEIKQSESYQMFIKYSTGSIPPKRSRGKGLQGKKAAVSSKPASVEVSG
ncbi:hypothetical protein Tco_0187949, partial [Tanacetum coccineum]